MEQQVLEVESNPQGPRPDWLPTVCAHRELFEDCALIFVGEDGELHSFKFVYASQSPYMACFSEIVRDSPDAEPADVTDIHNWQQTSGQRWARRYKIDLLKIFEDHQLPAMEEERMAVLPQLIFMSECLVVSDAEPPPWNRFIEGLPPARKSAPLAERSAGATSPRMQADLVAQYPWLAQLAQPSTTRSAASSTQTTAAMDTSDHPTEGTEAPSQGDQSLLDEAWADLYRARQELHQDDEAEPTDFRYTMLGGAWTMKNLGLAYDACSGRAATDEAQRWCRQFGMNISSRYSVTMFGDRAATALARAWCHRMQFFFSLHKQRDGDDFAYTREVLQSYVEPAFVGEAVAGLQGAALARLVELRRLCPGEAARSSV